MRTFGLGLLQKSGAKSQTEVTRTLEPVMCALRAEDTGGFDVEDSQTSPKCSHVTWICVSMCRQPRPQLKSGNFDDRPSQNLSNTKEYMLTSAGF